MGYICSLQVTFPLQSILFLALTDGEMFCFCEASPWWLPWLETELQGEKLSMEMMARQDFSRVTETGLPISKTSPAHWGWLVCWKRAALFNHPSLGSSCQLFNGLKKIQGSQDGTESPVPHEGGELSKHKGCFWQDKCKKKYSSLLGSCLVLEEIKLLTPWGGKSPKTMKIYGVCWTLIKCWTRHQSGNLRERDLCLLLILRWDRGITC